MTESPLDKALELAESSLGGVAPRPAVGAVVVANGEIVGEGATEARPGRHAEPVALAQAGDRAKGATLYCTLEPHAFQGVAPPCTDAIIAAGIARVVSPLEDPNPRVSGNGFRQLKSAGIEVSREATDRQLTRAESLIEGFAHSLNKGRPLVTLKLAMSLDGRMTTPGGESQWITNEQSRIKVHEMRHRSDAVITGIGTVLSDDPRLTARDENGSATGRPLLRVVVDSDARMPAISALVKEAGEVLWMTCDDAEPESPSPNVAVLKTPRAKGRVDLALLLDELGDRGLHNVIVESGSELAGAFLDGSMVDKVAAFFAPRVIGGSELPGPLGGLDLDSLETALSLERVTHTAIDGDILIEGYVRSDD